MSPKKVTKPLDIYVRVSDVRGRSGDSFISPAEQEERCRALAKARGYKVGEVFKDLDVSGGTMDRPGFNEAVARIRSGVSGGIIVAKLDRFARTIEGATSTLREINEHGGVFISVDGDWDTSTANGEMVLNILLAIAQGERGRIKENWQSAKRRAVDRGVHIAPRIPPGYKRNGGGRLEPDGSNAETIKRAFQKVASGDSYASVARYLNERELPVWHPINGKGLVQEAVTWQPNRIRRLLANRVYLGEARSGDGHVNPSAHQALVSAETWTLAQRQKDRREPTAYSRVGALLGGLVRCAGCRHAMRPQGRNESGNKSIAVYRCSKHTASGTCPEPALVRRRRLDEYVLAEFLAHVELEAEQVSVQDEDTDALVAAAVEAENAYRSILEDGELAREIGPADHARLVATYKANLEAAQAAVPLTHSATGNVDLRQLVADLQSAENVDGLRELLASAVQAVFVKQAAGRARNLPLEDRVHIVWHGDEALDLPRRGEAFGVKPYRW